MVNTKTKLNIVKDVQNLVKEHYGIIEANYSEEDSNGRRCNMESIVIHADLDEDCIHRRRSLSGYGSVWNHYENESRFDSMKLIEEILTYIELGYSVSILKGYYDVDYSCYKDE